MSPLLAARSGFLLPIVLLYIMVIGALGGTALLLSGAEMRLTAGDLRWLSRRLAEERVIQDPGDGGGLQGVALPGGFLLVRAGGRGAGPRPAALYWRLDPAEVSRGSALRVEVGSALEGSEVTRGGPGCGAVPPDPLVVRRPAGPPDPDPPLPPPPTLGPLGLERLLDRVGVVLPPSGSLGTSEAAVFLAPAGAHYLEGAVEGLLLAEGELTLGGTATFSGLALVRGDLRIEGSARLRGSARIGGGLVISESGLLELCPMEIGRTLALPPLEAPFRLGVGSVLGRF